ncbi:hypothetical protein C8J56DRAFT_1109716 [Mycena floridula]|nr:hypothetical protein C8J56DRAFT_1109716 [Mycena floridula]
MAALPSPAIIPSSPPKLSPVPSWTSQTSKFHQFAELAINPIVSPLPPRASRVIRAYGRRGGEEEKEEGVVCYVAGIAYAERWDKYFDIGKPREDEPEKEEEEYWEPSKGIRRMGRGESARPTNRTERLQDEYRVYRTGAEAAVLARPLPKPLDKSVEWLVGVLPLDSASELGGGEDDQPRSLTLRSLRLDDCQLRHPALEALCRGIRECGEEFSFSPLSMLPVPSRSALQNSTRLHGYQYEPSTASAPSPILESISIGHP